MSEGPKMDYNGLHKVIDLGNDINDYEGDYRHDICVLVPLRKNCVLDKDMSLDLNRDNTDRNS